MELVEPVVHFIEDQDVSVKLEPCFVTKTTLREILKKHKIEKLIDLGDSPSEPSANQSIQINTNIEI